MRNNLGLEKRRERRFDHIKLRVARLRLRQNVGEAFLNGTEFRFRGGQKARCQKETKADLNEERTDEQPHDGSNRNGILFLRLSVNHLG